MLKNISLILILAVLAYSQVGYYFVMRYYQHEQKEAIKEKIFSQLKEEDLQLITLDNIKNVYWEDESEFLLNGEMYDVVKRSTVNGKVILYCINDKKEKELINNYNQLTKHNSSSDKKGKSTKYNSVNLFVYDTYPEEDQFAIAQNRFIEYDTSLSENISDLTSPPPKA